jgi:hypothetical protein
VFVRFAFLALLALIAWAMLARPSEGADGERAYVVRAHDTLWSIAVRHYAGDPREAVWRIERRNDLDGALISPGERLVLP